MQMRSSRQFSFLNGTNKLVFIRMHGSSETTIPLLFACSALCFVLLVCVKSFRKKNKEFKTALITPVYNLKLSVQF